ncbi:MAG: AAA family ATPase, partial [Ruminococcaceae bacterium]|nr:AAA family ATPase [Oscillospiraceae bacterium]
GLDLRENVDDYYVRVGNFDDDTHYDLLSCLQKSIRGSDPDATAFYVAKLVAVGELISLCRRLQVIASEDVGLAYPQAAVIVRACCESALELGLPEARIPLINAALLLATAPKSNSAYLALAAAAEDVDAGRGLTVPRHLQSPLFRGYRYPHDYTGHYVRQQYLPDDLRDRKYYEYGENKTEQAAKSYADFLRQNGGKEKP